MVNLADRGSEHQQQERDIGDDIRSTVAERGGMIYDL